MKCDNCKHGISESKLCYKKGWDKCKGQDFEEKENRRGIAQKCEKMTRGTLTESRILANCHYSFFNNTSKQ